MGGKLGGFVLRYLEQRGPCDSCRLRSLLAILEGGLEDLPDGNPTAINREAEAVAIARRGGQADIDRLCETITRASGSNDRLAGFSEAVVDQGSQIDAMRQDQERGGMRTMAKGSRAVVVRRSADHPRASRGVDFSVRVSMDRQRQSGVSQASGER